MKKLNEISTFCSMPWSHLFIDPTGRIKPCCRFFSEKRSQNDKRYENLSEFFYSEDMMQIRSQMVNAQRIEGCQRCYDEEDAGKLSLRERYNNRKEFNVNASDEPKIRWIEMSFSNVCNMACRMCDDRYSNLWGRVHGTKMGTCKNPFLDEIIENLDSIEHIKITGGEPFLDPRHEEFISKLSNVREVSNFSLNYSTNGSIIPTSKLLKLWSKFKYIEVSLSIDSIDPKHFEFIRWPIKFNVWIESIKKWISLTKNYPNIKLGIRPTVSILNFTSLLETIQWWRQTTQLDWINPTHISFPYHYSLIILKKSQKEYLTKLIANQLEANTNLNSDKIFMNYLIKFMYSTNNDTLWVRALDKIKRDDQLRNQSFEEVYSWHNL